MFELAIVAAFGILAFRNADVHDDEIAGVSRRLAIGWASFGYRSPGMRENRFLRAEKALLTILKIDERNAAAYNRLGSCMPSKRIP